MPSRSLELVPGVTASVAQPASSFRLRPGERPAWVDVTVSDAEMQTWRRQAAIAGLSVDTWIALKLEWGLVVADVPDRTRLVAVIKQARHDAEAPRLAPSDELRRWLAFLTRGPQEDADHDLPSVALPARLVARIAPAALAATVVAEANETLDPAAVVIERAASLTGMTMESWAYRAIARLA